MKKDDIAVSIICDVYNHESYLRECFDGFIMQQTNFKFEILVHDDASIDKSAEIINEYTNRWPELFKPILQKENKYSKGIGIWKTYQFPRVKGKYVAICEGDDYWTDPFKLQKQVDILENNPDFGFCYTDYHLVDSESNVLTGYGWHERYSKKFKTGDLFYALLWHNFIQTCTIIYRADLKEKKYFEDGGFDYTLFLYLAGRTKFYYMNDNTACYRIQPNGLSTSGAILKTQLKKKNDATIYMCSKLYLSGYFPKRNFSQNIRIKNRIMYRVIQHDRIKTCYKEYIKIMKTYKSLFVFLPIALMHHALAWLIKK